ncbi:hypothetical protein GGF31_008447 [Allomyces arbusculus]|nr:hypothetical protein GGF31_008447 [Allomyces arbusculus]
MAVAAAHARTPPTASAPAPAAKSLASDAVPGPFLASARSGAAAHGDDQDEADDLIELMSRKFAHVRIDTTLPEEHQLNIRHLLPDHAHALVEAIESPSRETQHHAVVQLRRYLSMDNIPHAIDNVIAVPHLLTTLTNLLHAANDHAALQYEIAWALTNLAAGNHQQTAAVAHAGAIPVLLSALAHSEHVDVQIQAAWCLGNLCGDGPVLRNAVIEAGIVEAMLVFFRGRFLGPDGAYTKETVRARVTDPANVQVARILAWLMANLCRGTRYATEWTKLAPLFPVLLEFVHHEDLETVIDACWGLSRTLQVLGVHGSSDNKLAASLPNDLWNGTDASVDGGPPPYALVELSARLVALLTQRFPGATDDDHIRLNTPVLRAITNLASGDDTHAAVLVSAGAVPALCDVARACLLSSTPTSKSNGTSVTLTTPPGHTPVAFAREALLALSNMAAAGSPRMVLDFLAAGPVAGVWLAIATAAARNIAEIDRRAVRETVWGVANASSGMDTDVARTVLGTCDAEWRAALLALVACGLHPTGAESSANAQYDAEVREKAADAVHNLVHVLPESSWLHDDDARYLAENVLPWIPRRSAQYATVAATRDKIIKDARRVRERDELGLVDGLDGMMLG